MSDHQIALLGEYNGTLKNRKPNGFWFQAGPAFQHFQRLLHQSEQLLLVFELECG